MSCPPVLRRVARAAAGALGLMIALGSCGLVTSPGAPSLPAELILNGTVALSVPVPTAQGPILEVALRLDGRQLGSQTFSPGAATAAFGLPQQPIAPGDHVVSLQIVRQTSSPTIYRPGGAVVVQNPATGSSQVFQFPPGTSLSLSTGDFASLRFTVEAR